MAIPELKGTASDQLTQAIEHFNLLEAEKIKAETDLATAIIERDTAKVQATNATARADKAVRELADLQRDFATELQKAAALRAGEILAGTGRPPLNISGTMPDGMGGGRKTEAEVAPMKRVEQRIKQNLSQQSEQPALPLIPE